MRVCVRVSIVTEYSTCCLCLRMNRWKKPVVKSTKLSLAQITAVQGMGRSRFCHHSLPSASGPDAVRIECVLCLLKTTHIHILLSAVVHMCLRAVTQQCIAQFLTVGVFSLAANNARGLQLIIYLFLYPLWYTHQARIHVDNFTV